MKSIGISISSHPNPRAIGLPQILRKLDQLGQNETFSSMAFIFKDTHFAHVNKINVEMGWELKCPSNSLDRVPLKDRQNFG